MLCIQWMVLKLTNQENILKAERTSMKDMQELQPGFSHYFVSSLLTYVAETVRCLVYVPR